MKRRAHSRRLAARRDDAGRLGVWLLLSALLVATGATADEGRIPVYKITSVSDPGSYVVTRDIAASATDVIRIDSDGVVLDLNGHVISLMDGTGNGVVIGPAVTSATIRNGRIVGGANGVAYVAGAVRARIRLENLEIERPASYGVYVSGAESVELKATRVTSPGVDGVYVDGLSNPFSGRILDSAVENAGRSGFVLRGLRGGELRRNVVSGFSEAGIDLSADPSSICGGNAIEANTLRGGGPNSAGIEIGAGLPNNLVTGNVVTGNGLQGIVVASAGNRIAENQCSGNAGDGLRVDGGTNVVDRNAITGNAYGLRMACGNNRFRDNMLVGNSTSYCTGPCCGTANGGGNFY